MLKKREYPFLPSQKGPYVHSVIHENTLYISGLTAQETTSQKKEFLDQAQEVLSQIDNILEYEGRNKSDLIKLTIFIKDIEQTSNLRKALFQFYDGNLPACSLVEVSNLIHPDLKLEIEAIAAMV
ncbi:RidA family protein [Microbulbifer variabilis]|uniref:RidA family protein n=1 Tax=Microbulbifer variabilis TaxID=266805 RepID=A0ABY4VB93_9GAMM|nr:Rid family hydrolase [Microbulbifer variabilis]USD21215.1 RidA family protein [Microbulbifer variabilis]